MKVAEMIASLAHLPRDYEVCVVFRPDDFGDLKPGDEIQFPVMYAGREGERILLEGEPDVEAVEVPAKK